MANIRVLLIALALFACEGPPITSPAAQTDIAGFATSLRSATLERDLDQLRALGLSQASFAGDELEPVYQCHIYRIGECDEWMPAGWLSVSELLSNETVEDRLVCSDDWCWLTYYIASATEEELAASNAYMTLYVTTGVQLEASGWRLVGPLFNAGAGNPAADEYG
jgi:hypothetical protein